jgi:hypothetical protein
VVHFSGGSCLGGEYPNGLIKGTSYELLPRRTVCNGHNGLNMVLVNDLSRLHFPDVEGIGIGIIISDCEVNGFNWVPGETLTLVK